MSLALTLGVLCALGCGSGANASGSRMTADGARNVTARWWRALADRDYAEMCSLMTRAQRRSAGSNCAQRMRASWKLLPRRTALVFARNAKRSGVRINGSTAKLGMTEGWNPPWLVRLEDGHYRIPPQRRTVY
jgi:hypothetical protein